MGTTKQELYTSALHEIGERKVLITEDVTARRILDNVYAKVLEECLEAGSWNFAMETIKAESDTGIEPNFGYTEVFAKPSDWVRTHGVSEDEYFAFPLLQYYDDSNFWSSNNSPIYIRYVSNDTGMGLDLTRWPQSFTRYVELELASRICLRLTQSKSLTAEVKKERDKARRNAKNHDTMNEANPKFAPPGSWTRSRSGQIGRGDRGSRSSLTG